MNVECFPIDVFSEDLLRDDIMLPRKKNDNRFSLALLTRLVS